MRGLNRKTALPFAVAGGFLMVGLALLRMGKPRHDLRGQVVLISGGSRGLGLILARQFLESGATVIAIARSGEELERAGATLPRQLAGRFRRFTCDISDLKQVQDLLRIVEGEIGGIDLLVNNAGIIQVGPAETMGLEDLREALGANFWGVVHLTMGVLPTMLQRRAGRIVNVTSIGGVVAVPHLLPYTAGKFAAVGFSQGLYAELKDYGIHVTTIVPGLMRTGSFVNALFRGKPSEFSWFSLGATLPFVSMDAERAASRIIDAVLAGKAFATIGMPAKMLRFFGALLPGTTARLMALADRWVLPEPPDGGSRLRSGRELGRQDPLSRFGHGLRILGDRAAQKFNEKPI